MAKVEINRSAITGRIVKKAYAVKNPKITVTETVKKSDEFHFYPCRNFGRDFF